LVLQAALFAGFLSAFLIELLGRLEQDPMDIIQDVLIYQTQMMRNSSLGPYVPAEFSPPEYIVIVNALFYASLGVMILAAFIAMLIKSWVREFDRSLRAMSLPEQRAKTREFRYLGMERWKLPEMVAVLPLLLQLSLLLFSIGLVVFLFQISKPSFSITMVIFGVGVLYYAITTSISVFVSSSPFHSPLSRTLGAAYRSVHDYFCPSISIFMLGRFDITPASALGRLRRGIQIFLQKSRPYLAGDFVVPISATTMDEVQLSTAASALQRIHDSAPDSQHSEPLQSSVWQISGSPTLRLPLLLDLPSWIYDTGKDQEYLMRLPLDKMIALEAISLRRWQSRRGDAPVGVGRALRPTTASRGRWARVVDFVFKLVENSYENIPMNMIPWNELPWNELHQDECIWLLYTLSDLYYRVFVEQGELFSIRICVGILSYQALRWNTRTGPDIVFLEAVVAFVALWCSTDWTYRQTLSNNRHYPWLLLNLRNPELIRNMIEDAPDNCHKQLTSLLFLILYGLMWQRRAHLAAQYFAITTENGDFRLYTSALTTIAPAIGDRALSAIGRMLVAPRTESLTSIIDDFIWFEASAFQEELLQNYDHRLGATENPDPNFFAILLLLSKQLPSSVVSWLHELDPKLNNPWLKMAARVAARLDIPDGSTIHTGSFHDHRVHNMIAALSLRRYTEATPSQYTESLLLASFLGSQELSISALALGYYIQTILTYSDPSPPSCYFSGAVRAIFNLLLPDHQLHMGWNILDMFVNGFGRLSVEWRRTFAKAFFTQSCQSLPKLRGDEETSTAENELEMILTWGYFHEEERGSVFTDSCFSGLDWMVMAWSLHLSQQSGTVMGRSASGDGGSQDSGVSMVNEEFVLRVLCMLLDAAPHHQIIPVIPKLREFVQWFGDTEPSDYHSMIGARIEEAVHKHRPFQMSCGIHRFHCSWSM